MPYASLHGGSRHEVHACRPGSGTSARQRRSSCLPNLQEVWSGTGHRIKGADSPSARQEADEALLRRGCLPGSAASDRTFRWRGRGPEGAAPSLTRRLRAAGLCCGGMAPRTAHRPLHRRINVSQNKSCRADRSETTIRCGAEEVPRRFPRLAAVPAVFSAEPLFRTS